MSKIERKRHFSKFVKIEESESLFREGLHPNKKGYNRIEMLRPLFK